MHDVVGGDGGSDRAVEEGSAGEYGGCSWGEFADEAGGESSFESVRLAMFWKGRHQVPSPVRSVAPRRRILALVLIIEMTGIGNFVLLWGR
jgi:hypothetical protein